MEWALDLVLIVLLAVALFHALRLERALGVLKRDRGALEALVGAFNASTQMAEQGIDRLRQSADGAGRQITLQIDAASGLKNDLMFLSERAERLADRLEISLRSGRLVDPGAMTVQAQNSRATSANSVALEHVPTDWNQSVGSHAQESISARAAYVRPNEPQSDLLRSDAARADDTPVRLRSQAERDLLKALKLAR